MQPPICAHCHLDFRTDDLYKGASGGLVRFSDYQALPEGWVGHPEGVAWFCAKHIEAARVLDTLPLGKALARMRERPDE
jgi:hypothetical protein